MPNPLLNSNKPINNNNSNNIQDKLKTIMAMYNGDAKTAFYSLCKQMGIDPNTILSQLK